MLINQPKKNVRKAMLARIHIEFPKMRPDLRHSAEELKQSLYDLCTEALNVKEPVTSLRKLSDKQLGRVIEAIKDQLRQPALPGSNVVKMSARRSGLSCGIEQMGQVSSESASPESAEIIHTSGPEQVWAINRVWDFLKWGKEAREGFLRKRFRAKTAALLSPSEANSLLYILLRIATRAVLIEEGFVKPNQQQIASRIPAVKQMLGIGQKSDAETQRHGDAAQEVAVCK